ncbi:hypothetical protein VTL71DRAFT_2993 [Oculimacula yallundae]|uniref:Uncharacterized protein n=1 Tax=Oculimacula yallundae TaxID=86028 RepID=A0ABR4C5X3_9HELO
MVSNLSTQTISVFSVSQEKTRHSSSTNMDNDSHSPDFIDPTVWNSGTRTPDASLLGLGSTRRTLWISMVRWVGEPIRSGV